MSVTILNPSPPLQWNGSLTTRSSTNRVIFHHAAVNTASVHDIHNDHLNLGWEGIGYNFYIRKNGDIYAGRGWNKVGAHASGYNSTSVGICCEGYYHHDNNGYTQEPPRIQIKSLIELIIEAKKRYTITSLGGHNDFNNTDCPGNLFPKSAVIHAVAVYSQVVTACAKLAMKGIINTQEYWIGYFWCLQYLDDLLINCSNQCKNYITGNYTTVASAIQRLANAQIINSPNYWLNNYSSVQYLGDFLKSAANHA